MASPTASIRRGVAAVGLVALLALTTAGSALADTGGGGPVNVSSSGSSASLFTSDCTSNRNRTTTCHDTNVFAFVGMDHDKLGRVIQKRSEACLFLDTYTFDDRTGNFISGSSESGCAEGLPSSALQISKLTSAALGATITVTAYDCSQDPCVPISSRDVDVSATWTGTGSITSQKSRFVYDDGVCFQVSADKSSYRGATVSGTVDGTSIANADANLSDGRFTFKSTAGCGGG
ncbi:MAG TPA: hypothetical protein VFJ80_08040 [Candidatus Limnocylindrales bacterium]|jgi:hypothetical protein|nr:hypothetical protein [Candidatus Limnocylindrales bacterium]